VRIGFNLCGAFSTIRRVFDGCIDEEYRPKAFNILRKMEARLPIWKEQNGDHFRSGLSHWTHRARLARLVRWLRKPCNDQRSHRRKKTWKSFQNWSRVCFRPPTSLFWGDFNSFKAIKWTTEYFDAEYFRAGR